MTQDEKNGIIAYELAKQQRDIGVAEFFSRNRHLLGFDNKRKALLTTIKEAVDNALDACEEARIMPEVIIEVVDMQDDRFKVIVEDNGPGIVKKQIPNIFAKLLYGSKFHTLKQSRGQQGIGISAAVMYGQLTTGKPAKITSRIDPAEPSHYFELRINTQQNKPEIIKEEVVDWKKDHGTKIEIDLEASYIAGGQSIDEYLKQTAIVNPHVTIIYTNPKAEQTVFARAVDRLPIEPKSIKPHPYGVELGNLISMLRYTEAKTLQSFLVNEFSRVGSGTAKQICENAALLPNTKPQTMSREMTEQLMKGISQTKLVNPPTECISPITGEDLEKGLRKEVNAEFYFAISRPPSVYRGNPFLIEAGLAYGGNQPADDTVRLIRFANRVPLLYQQSACAITRSVINTAWKSYGLNQSRGALPSGPITIVVHIASVWVPFTSESKEAIAHYPEIIKEIKLCLQELGRKLQLHVHKKKQVQHQLERANLFEKYIPEVADSLARLTGLTKEPLLRKLQEMIKKSEIQREIMQMEELKGDSESASKTSKRSEEDD
ncbi:MAG: DNA topoisomerase VI subunit B [Candidatus Woesearchaeota archaeon]